MIDELRLNTKFFEKYGKSKLKKGNTYYVKVTAQKKVGKKYVSVDDPYCYPIYY